MKDQFEKKLKTVDDEIETAQRHMNCICSIYERLAKKNGKLNEIIESDAEFSDKFSDFQKCLDEIQSDVEDLTPDELLTQYDLQDKINISMYDNSLSGRG